MANRRDLEETETILKLLERTHYKADRHQLTVLSDEERQIDFSQNMDAVSRVRRFLRVGNDRNTYHTEKYDLAVGDVDWLIPIINEGKAGHILREAFLAGQSKVSAKQEVVSFTLALLTHYRPDWAALGGPRGECLWQKVQAAAYQVFLKVCRDSESLFAFTKFSWLIAREPAKLFANTYFAAVDVWDNAMRDAIKNWYLQMRADELAGVHELAMQITLKCRRGSRLSHRTLLMKANINPNEMTAMNRPEEVLLYDQIFHFACNGKLDAAKRYLPTSREPPTDRSRMNYRLTIEMVQKEADSDAIDKLHAVAEVRKLRPGLGEARCAQLIRRNGLQLEHVSPELLNSAVVWSALLEVSPVSVILANLSKLAALGVLCRNYRDDMTYAELASEKIADGLAIAQEEIHPLSVFLASNAYRKDCEPHNKGHGQRSSRQWTADPGLQRAMGTSYEQSLLNALPTERRFCIAMDVSGTMDRTAHGTSGVVTCREAALALIKVLHATEPHVKFLAFQEQMEPLPFDGSEEIPEMVEYTQDLLLGHTHCDRPILWALDNQQDFDVFVVLTDYDVRWQKDRDFGALQRYRMERDVPHARLVVVGLKSTHLDLACRNDAGVLGICGFGAPVLDIIQQFALGMV